MEKYFRTVIIFSVFLVFQIVSTALLAIVSVMSDIRVVTPSVTASHTDGFEKVGLVDATFAGVSSILISVFIIAFLHYKGYAVSKEILEKAKSSMSSPKCILIILLALAGLFAADLYNQVIDFPDLMAMQVKDISFNPFGMIASILFYPVAQEWVFREGMMGSMLKNGVSASSAILVSSFLSTFLYLSPSHLFYAFAQAAILGVLYIRTRSVVMTSVTHIICNFIIVFQNVFVNNDNLADTVGKIPVFLVATVFTAVSFGGLYVLFSKSETNSAESVK